MMVNLMNVIFRLKELKKVEDVICETLNGIFHTRIEYPNKKRRRNYDVEILILLMKRMNQ